MDREEFHCDEYKNTDEYLRFPAEEYCGREMLNHAMETFSSRETGNTAPSASENRQDGLSRGDIEKLHSQSSSSENMYSNEVSSGSVSSTGASSSAGASSGSAAGASASVAASASAGVTTGVFASIAAVCVAVTTGVVPVEGITQNTADESPVYPIEEPIDVGTLDFLNYRVEYYPDEGSDGIYSDITFYFEGELADGLTCEISETLSGKSVALNNNEATFTNVERGDREFLLSIYDGEKVVETRTVSVEDGYLYDESLQPDYAYKVTYNTDGTDNVYAYFTPDREGEFVTYIHVRDYEDGFDKDYETVTDGALSYVANVAESNYSVDFVSYYVKNGNYYSYYSSEQILIEDADLYWTANVQDDSLTLIFGDKIVGDLQVKVTHDDMTFDEFTLPAEELSDNACTLTLSKISHNPTVEISGNYVIYAETDPNGYITSFNGEECKPFVESQTVVAVVSSKVELARCEIFNTSYNVVDGDTNHAPVYLYFDGYLNEGDVYTVTVVNADGEIVDERTDLTLLGNPVIFNTLLVDTTYTFQFFLYANGEESSAGELTRTLTVPQFSDLSSPFCNSPNPGDVMITYNEDGTSNVYLYMNVREKTYDMYYKVYLENVEDKTVVFECVGKENVAVLKNIPAGTYSLKYGVMINDNGTCYSAYDMTYPSGTIVTGLDANGNYPEYSGNAIYDSKTGELSVSVWGKTVGGLQITVMTDDGQTIELTVPAEDVSVGYSNSTCTIDLSAYGLTTFTSVVTGKAIYQYGEGDVIKDKVAKDKVAIAGSESCPFRIETAHEQIEQ